MTASTSEKWLERIARLASLSLQVRFIDNATVDHYYVPEELLNDAHGVVHRLVNDTGFCDALPPERLEALRTFAAVLEREIDHVNISSADLVRRDPAWTSIRNAAVECVRGLGFDLRRFEERELRELTP